MNEWMSLADSFSNLASLCAPYWYLLTYNKERQCDKTKNTDEKNLKKSLKPPNSPSLWNCSVSTECSIVQLKGGRVRAVLSAVPAAISVYVTTSAAMESTTVYLAPTKTSDSAVSLVRNYMDVPT